VPRDPSMSASRLGWHGECTPAGMTSDPWLATVGSVMHRHFIVLAPADSLLEAERMMRMARVRSLPVADAEHLVGMLSYRALLEGSLAEYRNAGSPLRWLAETSVANLMERDVAALTTAAVLREAAPRLLAGEDGCLPVVAPQPHARLVGVLTETDLLRAAYGPRARRG
jgi:CBS-domain-containing membrane protein